MKYAKQLMVTMLAAGLAVTGTGAFAGGHGDSHGHADTHAHADAHADAHAADAHGADAHAADSHAPAKADKHAKVSAHGEAGVSPEQALTFLRNGNTRFKTGKLRKDGQSQKDIARLSTGQKPHTIVLSCSDSRVPPEIVFDQKLGEIFVVRTAGETLDPTSIASIEYAIEHLGSHLLLVMGHTQCGAVKAALSTMGGQDAGSPNLNKLVADIHPRIQEFSRAPASVDFGKESLANARGVVKDLLARSAIIKNKVNSGDVRIESALYHLENGAVDFQ